MTVKKGTKGKSYNLTPEAAKAMDDLNDKIDNMGKSEIASEAIIQFALANGVKVKGKKKLPSIENMAEASKMHDIALDALCNIALRVTAEIEEEDIDNAEVLVQQAVNNGTKRTPTALWKKLQNKLPRDLRDEDYFMAMLQLRGIPEEE